MKKEEERAAPKLAPNRDFVFAREFMDVTGLDETACDELVQSGVIDAAYRGDGRLLGFSLTSWPTRDELLSLGLTPHEGYPPQSCASNAVVDDVGGGLADEGCSDWSMEWD